MSRWSGLTCRLRRYLADRLARLKATLADLGRRLRATVAARVADNVAGIVQDVVETALAEPAPDPVPRVGYHNPPTPWHDPDDEPPPYQPSAPEDLFGGYPHHPHQDDDEPEPAPTVPSPPSAPQRWRTALAAGLQAGACCLRRRGPGSLLKALAVSAGAGLVAFFGGAFLADCALTVGSLLSLAG